MPTSNREAPEEHIESLLASEPLIDDLLCLAQASAATPRLQVLTLAGALAQAAVEGGLPDSFVFEVVQASLAAVRETKPMDLSPAARGLWAKTKLRVHDAGYRLVSLPPGELGHAAEIAGSLGPGFGALIVEPSEVSMSIPEGAWGFEPV